jgi:hypothetical protein
MSIEQEHISEPDNIPHEIQERIEAYFSDTTFGSEKFIALGDCVDKCFAEEVWIDALEKVSLFQGGSRIQSADTPVEEGLLAAESRLRMAEQRQVMIEQRIKEHHRSIPMHYVRFSEIEKLQDELVDSLLDQGLSEEDCLKSSTRAFRNIWEDIADRSVIYD